MGKRRKLDAQIRNEKNRQKCKQCGKDFIYSRPHEKGIFCSYKCMGISNRQDRVNRNGYWYVYKPKHHYVSNQGYVAEHHLIYEKHHKMSILKGMVIHHKNEIKKDNAINNLQLMTDKEHKSHHAKIRERNKKGEYD